ncbi:MAG: UMP kinase [Syntrophus sp. (in: bacteria)]|nr:UMP kinase [Syntrophus sp. (in: bacteria)]MBA4418416.1 UMP kinase [Syntrophus sp. (in: bacteria)]
MEYKRILLKLSGEALMGKEGYGLDPDTLAYVASEIRNVKECGVQIALVVGGGNIMRGVKAEKQGIDRVTGDYMGMIATVINALGLQAALENIGLPARVQSAIRMDGVAEPYITRKAIKHLEQGRIVIFAGGTGNPYFTTDTAAALRAVEIGADVMCKATKVDGIYDKDPVIHKDAVFFREVTYTDAITGNLGVMDLTAITLCRDNRMPIIVFNISGKDNMKNAVLGEPIGTIVRR